MEVQETPGTASATRLSRDNGPARARIRNAVKADIPRIVEMGERFFKAMARSDIGAYSHETAKQTARMLIDNPLGILLVSDTGMIGGMVYPFYMTGELTAQEFFWWSEGTGGRSLLRAFEVAAKIRGARTVNMIVIETLFPERVARIYMKAGYSPAERTYIKEI